MTGKQRMMTALDRKQPDRVPIWELGYNEPTVIALARHFNREHKTARALPPVKYSFHMDAKEQAQLDDAYVTMYRGLDLDGITAEGGGLAKTPVDERHVKDNNGVVYHLDETILEPVPISGPIQTATDLHGFAMAPPRHEDFSLLGRFREEFPDKALTACVGETFKYSWGLRGNMANLLLDIATDPDLVDRLADVATAYTIQLMDVIIDLGVDFVSMEGDLAHNGGPLMSPADFDRFYLPHYKRIVDHVHRRGIKIVKHSDGKMDALMPAMLTAGFDGLHPFQPQCMDMTSAKKQYGEQACICGNIDCAFLLVVGTMEEVRQTVKKTIAAVAPGGGYIITSSNSVHSNCKPELYLAMVDAAREYGDYENLPQPPV